MLPFLTAIVQLQSVREKISTCVMLHDSEMDRTEIETAEVEHHDTEENGAMSNVWKILELKKSDAKQPFYASVVRLKLSWNMVLYNVKFPQ